MFFKMDKSKITPSKNLNATSLNSLITYLLVALLYHTVFVYISDARAEITEAATGTCNPDQSYPLIEKNKVDPIHWTDICLF